MQSNESIWQAVTRMPTFPAPGDSDRHVDVAIVGGGITGVTAATLLKAAGKRVALLEAHRIASGVSGRTTAHITEIIDTRYYELAKSFGRDGARLAAQSSRAAIEQIATLVERFTIDCDFTRVPGYLFTEIDDDVDEIRRELEAAHDAGLTAELAAVPLPVVIKAGIHFPNQAQFNPLAYLAALSQRIPGDGSEVFEQARVLAIDEGEPCRLHLESGATITSERVILATHVPLNRALMSPKLAQYRSYVVAGPTEQSVPGLFWDTRDPYHYVRRYRVGDRYHWIVGGADHKTGKEPKSHDPFADLQHFAARIGLHEIEQRWSAQVVEPVDGLPFIGRNAASEHVYVATGFSGNGMTFGTLGAMILTDACLGRANPYADLYAATRIKVRGAVATFLGENIDFPMHLLSDRIRPPDARSLGDIAPREGKILRVNGERLAVYRDDAGRLHAVSPVCTHLGCHVKFNPAERTWDCPCHGSRFTPDGDILDGPALRPLKQRPL